MISPLIFTGAARFIVSHEIRVGTGRIALDVSQKFKAVAAGESGFDR
jgi:hypothetical protein